MPQFNIIKILVVKWRGEKSEESRAARVKTNILPLMEHNDSSVFILWRLETFIILFFPFCFCRSLKGSLSVIMQSVCGVNDYCRHNMFGENVTTAQARYRWKIRLRLSLSLVIRCTTCRLCRTLRWGKLTKSHHNISKKVRRRNTKKHNVQLISHVRLNVQPPERSDDIFPHVMPSYLFFVFEITWNYPWFLIVYGNCSSIAGPSACSIVCERQRDFAQMTSINAAGYNWKSQRRPFVEAEISHT